jgi:hypothetical protein
VSRLSAHRLGLLAAVAVTLAATVIIVVAQPIRSPWWTYADADASYTGASLNLLRGTSIRYLDHPGLPVEELLTIVFAGEHAIQRLGGGGQSTNAFVDERMLDFGKAKSTWRTLAVAIYFLGALLSCLLASRLFAGWAYGVAGGLFWLCAPGLAAMSIQYRPDVVLGVFVVVATFLLGRAAERRSAATFAAAAFTIGVAMMVKMHAVGLLAALAMLAATREPTSNEVEALPGSIRRTIALHRVAAAVIAVLWVALALYLNRGFRHYSFSTSQILAFVVPAVLVVGYAAVAITWEGTNTLVTRVFNRFYAVLAASLLVGLLVPVTLDVPDGLTSLIHIKQGLLGGGINTGVPAFATPLHHLIEPPLRQALVIFVVAGIAAVVGLRRRDPLPAAWFLAAAILGVMAQARLATLHYFAPAYLVSVFGVLWLVRAIRPPVVAVVACAALVAIVAVPQFRDRAVPKHQTQLVATEYVPPLRYAVSLLKTGEVVLAPPTWPSGSDWYSYVVQPVVNYTPRYPYTVVEADTRGVGEAQEQGLRPAYYTGPGITGGTGSVQTMAIGDLGNFRVKVLNPNVVKILGKAGS